MLRRHGAPRPALVGSVKVEVVAAELSAQHVVGQQVVDEDGVVSFEICDDDTAIELSHEIGDPEAAARALDQLATGIHAHAEWIRSKSRSSATWT